MDDGVRLGDGGGGKRSREREGREPRGRKRDRRFNGDVGSEPQTRLDSLVGFSRLDLPVAMQLPIFQRGQIYAQIPKR